MKEQTRDWMDFLGVLVGGAALMGGIWALASGKSFLNFFGLALYAMIIMIVSIIGTTFAFIAIGEKRNPNNSSVGWAIAGFLVGLLFTAPLMNAIITKVIGFK